MKKAVFVFLVLAVLFAPALSFAATVDTQLVPGTALQPASSGTGTAGNDFTICDLRVLANNVINFAVMLSVFVATLMFAYGGVLYLTGAAGGDAQIKKAHSIFLNAVVGILIVLLAWLIVNIVLSVLTNGTVEFWTGFSCEKNPVTGEFPIATVPAAPSPGIAPVNSSMPVLPTNAKDQLVGVNPDLVKLVNAAHQCSTVPFVVTSGFREASATACNSRHLYGLAVDVHPVINGGVNMTTDGSTRVAPNANYVAIDQGFRCASQQTGVPFDWGGASATFMKYGYDSEHFQLSRSVYPDNGSLNQCN